ncbi:MAG: hypothetical protein H6566_01415 [Lewinellaceae bacterium]|nr:hypothetical protein [Lewinellaceae bacterium]
MPFYEMPALGGIPYAAGRKFEKRALCTKTALKNLIFKISEKLSSVCLPVPFQLKKISFKKRTKCMATLRGLLYWYQFVWLQGAI